LVFNGAIYNARELSKELGYQGLTDNDGEIVLELYKRHGLRFIDFLEGMYAVCIVDEQEEDVILALDPVGIKPLYISESEEGIYFSSEVRGFQGHGLKNIRRFLPGSSYSVKSKTTHRRRLVVDEPRNLEELLRDSVESQIPREVGWATMLSGGIDSSLITKFARDLERPVISYTCGREGDTDYSASVAVARELEVDHRIIDVEDAEIPELVELVVRQTNSMERWTIAAGVPTYIVARAARADGLKVLLSGEGADELFGGYDEFQGVSLQDLNPMLVQYQQDLGTSECLRLDRMTMVASIEARVPFLSAKIIAFARNLSPEEKIGMLDGAHTRKVPLHRLAQKHLPALVTERKKAEFSHGSGLSRRISDIARSKYSDTAIMKLDRELSGHRVSSAEDAWYLDIWLQNGGREIGDSMSEMQSRGLFRQHFNPYLAIDERYMLK